MRHPNESRHDTRRPAAMDRAIRAEAEQVLRWLACDEASDFIAHPLFNIRNAQGSILGDDEVESLCPMPRRHVLSREEEQTLFLQYNYCRFRLAQLKSRAGGRVIGTAALAEARQWGRGSLIRRDRLVECNLGLVPMMIRTSRAHSMDYDELVSAGHLAIIHAVNKFNVSLGFRFSTYVCQAIQRSIGQAVSSMLRHRQRWTALPHEAYDIGSEDGELANYESLHEVRQLHQVLHDNVACLTEMELGVIRRRFPLPAKPMTSACADSMTREEVGRIHGVTKERVRQIEHKALTKLRQALEQDHARARSAREG